MTVAIIIPTYNERRNIEILVERIIKNVKNVLIYIIDDNSPDGTKIIAEILHKKYPSKLYFTVRKRKTGRGGAVIEGFKQAIKNSRNKYFIEMDADLSHSPEEISKLLEKAREGVVCVGSRYIKGSKIINWPLYRRVLSKFANYYIRFVLGVPIYDFTNGFRCYPRTAVELIVKSAINHKGFICLSETAYILFKKGFKLIEIPIIFRDREKGNSNATIIEVLGSFFAVLQIRFDNET